MIDPKLKFKSSGESGNTHEYIIIHHALAKKCTVEDVHKWHLANGWIGIGYHFFISKSGEVFKGRTINWIGAHCKEENMNTRAIGICLEGCYQDYKDQTDKEVPKEQLSTLQNLVASLMGTYSIPPANVKRHTDFAPYKLCPGNYFPWEAFVMSLSGTPILGPAQATVEQAKEWAKDRGAANFFIDLADLFWIIAPKVSVRPEVAYAQSAKETGFGKFGGVINATYNNPCGLKTTAGGGNSDPDAHMRFPDWNTGILAQCQHLALYAGGFIMPPIVDPRHFSFIRYKAPTVEALGGAWAPSTDYGQSIIKNYLTPLMQTVVPVKVDWKAEAMKNFDGLINSKHDPDSPVTWAELGAVIGNLRKEF